MPVMHASRGLRGAARAAVAVAVAVALLASTPGMATAADSVAATSTTQPPPSPAELQAIKARLLAAIEPCSTKVPRNDIDALGRCALDLAVPDTKARGIIELISRFIDCLWLQYGNGPGGGLYPSFGDCMEAGGY
ncbi:hypothetical protein ACFO1B_25515 [Dactylosporangium siamense]|uniref:Uncharacterized protein n=1 Tax=Dactylosporangium siamense TaxID=685454 RepID=A0A919PM64_9ACTN|nr:hypothetical protein [Dactylosporangium siamense]GIG47340.1 hypothetical protein Dsi01nite_053810 [Dactylosporangium siamense]